jgi:transketolase
MIASPLRPVAAPPAPDPLADLALRVREHVVRMAGRGGCFIGASLSCADLLVHLYQRVLNVAPERRDDPDRDYLFLSKGHDVPALYGLLAELGYFPPERLAHHLDPIDSIYWHPNRALPGIEFHSGSLGHLLSVAMGVALDAKLAGGPTRAFVVLGDGELDEGSCWEGFLVAAALKLDNLVAVIDRNGFQANLRTEQLVPLEPLGAKLAAFGWSVRACGGHDFGDLARAFSDLPAVAGRPTVVIAETLRGKGVPSLEGRGDRWFARFTPDEVEGLLAELHGARPRPLTSPTLVVR